MLYRTSRYGKHRHVIVDYESCRAEMKVTSNLADYEFKIELLMAEDCPIRTSCVRIEEEVNSICDYLGSFRLEENRTANFTELTCLHGGGPTRRKVEQLWVEGCPLGKNCAGCEDLLSIHIPSSLIPDKSHAYITCQTRRRTSDEKIGRK